jgi:hypothetical protein
MTSDLYDLIHSLSKTEKRHLKLRSSFHGGEKQYVRLFDILDSLSAFDSRLLQEKWSAEGYGNTLPITKNYLYQFILSGLEHYHAESGHKAQVQTLLKRVDILFDKALYKQCIKLLIKARKLAEQFQTPRFLLEISVWELRLMVNPQYNGELKKTFEELFVEEQQILESLTLVNYARTYRFVADKLPKLGLHQINAWIASTEHPFVICELERLKAIHYKKKNKFSEALAALDREIETLESNYSLLQNREGYSKYVSAFGVALEISQEANQIDKTMYYLEKLNPKQTEQFFTKSSHLKLKVFVHYYIHLLDHLVWNEDQVQLIRILKTTEASLQGWSKKLQSKITNPLLYLMAVAYLSIGDRSRALKTVNELIGEKYEPENERLILDSSWFQLIVHFEKENLEAIDYLLESLKRKLKKASAVEAFDGKMLSLFSNLMNTVSEQQRKKLFVTFLQKNKEWPSRKLLFNYQRWVQHKAT